MCPKHITQPRPTLIDRVGQRFGRLVVTQLDKPQKGLTYWICQCDCGNTTSVRVDSLRTGYTQSCGCLQREAAKANKVHGMWQAPIYKRYYAMIQRCKDSRQPGYKNYGGRGIRVCEEWIHSFQEFYKHVSSLPNFGVSGYSLDRIDNDGNYEPGNVRWATRMEQKENMRKK